MKLKTLVIAVLVLAGLALAVHFATRPAPPVSSDARLGQAVLDPAIAASAAHLTLTQGDATVTVAKTATGEWRVTSYHDFPADFAKLSRFIRELTDAKVDRFVTASPERLARLEFSDTTIMLADASGSSLWSLTLGKTADNGGRFLKFGDEDRAYLARLSTFLDTTAKNWADSALVSVKPADIASVEIGFADDLAPVVASRASADAPFTAAAPPEGQQLKSSTVTPLLTTLTGLRFIDTTPFDDADAVDARAHERTIKLTTFNGRTVTLALGRRPERTEVKTPEPAGPAALASVADAADPTPAADVTAETTTIPAGPVFVRVTDSNAATWTNAVGEKLAFKISDFPFTGLPADRASLFEPQPAEPPAQPPSE